MEDMILERITDVLYADYNITREGEQWCLHSVNQVVMIWRTHIGQAFFNQTNCVSCLHREVKGIVIPLHYPAWFNPKKKRLPFENCMPQAEDVVLFLIEQPKLSNIEIDECSEAWVTFRATFFGRMFDGVLTWQNCD